MLILSDDFACSWEYPMASNTWLASIAPEEQAEPEETAIPSRSRQINRLSALIPSNPRLRVFGRLSLGVPKTKQCSTSSSESNYFFLKTSHRLSSSERLLQNHSKHSAKAQAIATFSVPARRLRSWPPPVISGENGDPSRM